MVTFFDLDLFDFINFDGLLGRGESLWTDRTGSTMTSLPQLSEQHPDWSPEAYAIASQARVVSGNRLEELVVRLQRKSGRTKDQCWRFIIQRGLKRKTDHRRWSEDEVDDVREDLVKMSLEDVAAKLRRTPQAIRSMLRRRHLSMREIRCDRFSLESLSIALRIRKAEIQFWISEGWLQATVEMRGHKRSYTITPEALTQLYKRHLPQLLARGAPNLSLFQAYLQYCYSPQHTIGKQLLDVRRDKKERAAADAASGANAENGEDEDEDNEGEERYHLDIQADDGATTDSDPYSG